MIKQTAFLLLFGLCLGDILVAQTAKRTPGVSIELSKMNVLYVGIENPIEVFYPGLSATEYRLQTDKGVLVNKGNGKFTIKVKSPGAVNLSIWVGGSQVSKQVFFAKRVPNPVPALGAKFFLSDTIKPGEFKAQGGIFPILQNFDFDVKCDMIEYKVTLVATYHESGALYMRSTKNVGKLFTEESTDIMSEGVPGDIVIFSDIKARCPGDEKDRDLNALVFFLGEKGGNEDKE